jgi:Tripartite tricarboxylate transporter TctB family
MHIDDAQPRPPAIARHRDLLAGLAFLVFGAAVATLSVAYPMGSARRIGPGLFPTILAVGLMLVGALLSLQALRRRAPITASPAQWRALASTLGAVAAFALLLQPAGLALTVFVSALACAAGVREFALRRAALIALSLSLGCSVVFVGLLELRVPLWPAFAMR